MPAPASSTRAVIFDLDGTLIDSLDDIHAALISALAGADLPPPSRDAVRQWIGGGARNLIEQAAPADRVDVVLAAFRRHYDAEPAARTSLYDGIVELLDELVRRDLPVAVLSNKPHELTVRIASDLLTRWPLRAVVGHRTGVALKPDPASALAVCQALDVPAAACSFVGDSAVDIETARAAGMRAIAVTWGFRPRHELVAAGPDEIIDHPSQLPPLL